MRSHNQPRRRGPLRRTWLLALLGLCALAAGPLVAVPPDRPQPLLDSPQAETAAAAKYVENQLLVRFRPGVPQSWQEAAHAGVKTRVLRRFRQARDVQLIELPEGLSVEEAIEAYRRDPNVLYAEPNYIVHAFVFPNDPRFTELWGLHYNAPYGINAPAAWDITTGSSSVVVAVIDSGIQYTHPDLAANMHALESNCADGVDNDGNGRVDDCFGIDTVNNDNNPMDDVGHGTHVAGTIGAVGNNSTGVVGVNWQVGLLACKFLGPSGGTTSGAIACLDYLADLKQNHGLNLVATNNSWGGSGFSQALFDAVDAHRQLGILFIAAAGNEFNDNDFVPTYPAGFYLPNVIAVAATLINGAITTFSNYGRHTVHLAAPGLEILSTVPNNSYAYFDGTSMAAPHVAGVVALLKADNPARDWIAIKNLILAGGSPMTTISWFPTMTKRLLSAFGSLTCSNSAVLAPLLPTISDMAAVVGEPIDLAALHINCAAPNGPVQVTVRTSLGTLVDTVTLQDDGTGIDQVPGDGIYSGQWTPPERQDYTLSFPDGPVVTVTAVEDHTVKPIAVQWRSFTGTNLNLGDDATATVNLPFTPRFGGRTFSPAVEVNSNGFLQFFPVGGPFPNPNRSIPNKEWPTMVAPFWDDLYPGLGTARNVFWAVTGDPGHRELVVQWRGVSHFRCRTDSTVRVNFQVVLFEGSDTVLFNYADTVFGGRCGFADRGGSATVGIQSGRNAGGQYSFNSPVVGNSTALLWEVDADAPAPVLSSLSPSSIGAGSATFTLTVNGSGFTSDSLVQWNGSARDTVFVSPSQLRATILASDVTSVGTAGVTVFTPAPGGGTTAPLTFSIVPNSFFRGRVQNLNLVGIAGATITAYQSGVPLYSTTTNSTGGYSLNVAAGTYDVEASMPGFFPRTRFGQTVGANQTVTGIDFRLARECFFQGRVTSAADGSPIAGATVGAYRRGVLFYSTTTAADGTYSLLVHRTTYVLWATAPGFTPQRKTNQTISDGQTITGVNFALPPQ